MGETGRHLVLEMRHDGEVWAVVPACATEPEPHDRVRHTFLAALTTCPACQAVQAARVVLLDVE